MFFFPQALEALGEAIKPYLLDGPAGAHVLCNEIDTGGALIEMTLQGTTADGKTVQLELMVPGIDGADDRVQPERRHVRLRPARLPDRRCRHCRRSARPRDAGAGSARAVAAQRRRRTASGGSAGSRFAGADAAAQAGALSEVAGSSPATRRAVGRSNSQSLPARPSKPSSGRKRRL